MEIPLRWRVPLVAMVVAVALPLALIIGLSLPGWAAAIVVVLSLGVGVGVARQALFQHDQAALRQGVVKERPKPEPTRHEHHVPSIPVDSAEPFYRFMLSCTVCWTQGEDTDHGNPRGLAVHTILERAGQITVAAHPTDASTVAVRLAAELGVKTPVAGIVVWAEDIGLAVPEADLARLTRLAEVRKDKEIQQQERELEQSARAYLAENVLTDPGRAMVWWLARHPEQVREAAALLPIFAELAAAVTGTEIAPRYANAQRLPGEELRQLTSEVALGRD